MRTDQRNNPERELARPVVEHFRGLGIVFPEVTCRTSGDRADLIVLRADASLDVVEVKARPCERLERQARGWIDSVERVWVAYEPPRRGAVTQRWLARFKGLGVGVLHVIAGTVTVTAEAREREAHPFFRTRIVATLSPLHEHYAEAGNADSHYLTAFRLTCDRLRVVAEARPGLTMRDAVESIQHHYTSDKVARSALLGWVRAGKVAGIRAEVEAGKARLYPSTVDPAPTLL